MHNERYSNAALHTMYMEGKGILSPVRFSEKQKSYQWIGFAIGVLGTMAFLKILGINIEGWVIYLALGGSLLSGIVGAVVMNSVFDANFVLDESLVDPFFLNRR